MLTAFSIFCASVAATFCALIGDSHGPLQTVSLLASYLLAWSVALWVQADAAERGTGSAYDFDSLIFVLWPVAAPVYLVRTRGWGAIGPMGVFFLLFFRGILFAILLAYPQSGRYFHAGPLWTRATRLINRVHRIAAGLVQARSFWFRHMRVRFINKHVRVSVLLGGIAVEVLVQNLFASPPEMVPDEVTAVRIAEAVLASKYGVKDMEGSRPYKALLTRGVWHVSGTVPKDSVGVVPSVDIDQKVGCILSIGAHWTLTQI